MGDLFKFTLYLTEPIEFYFFLLFLLRVEPCECTDTLSGYLRSFYSLYLLNAGFLIPKDVYLAFTLFFDLLDCLASLSRSEWIFDRF